MLADDAGDDGELLVALADALAGVQDARAVHPYETAPIVLKNARGQSALRKAL